jgi:hypothetical protein
MDVDYDDTNDGNEQDEDVQASTHDSSGANNPLANSTNNLSGAVIASPANKLLEHAQTFLKLLKRLKGALEDDSREYNYNDLNNDITLYDKKYKLNGALHRTLKEGFDALNESRSYNHKELDNYKRLLVSIVEVYSKNYRDCKSLFLAKYG